MFSLTLSPQPKSMQQIAALIITFAAYVAGIRNGGIRNGGIRNGGSGANDGGAIADYESFSTPYNEDFFPPQSLVQHAAGRQSNDFRPSQMLEFTPADATAPKHYPPSYLQSDYYTKQRAPSGPALRHEASSPQFAFPSEREQATSSSSAIVTTAANIYNNNNNNNNAFVYNHRSPQRPQQQQQSPVPPQLQSTPILTYRDPYTNELDNHQFSYGQAGQRYQSPPPQEYTVQSMLVVGAADQPSPPSRPHNEHTRPGYVFDEQLSPSYARPTYAADKYSAVASDRPTLPFDYRRRQQQPPERLAADSGAASSQLSYDSHDYPPPSYHQQQTSNFQSPQRHDTANYAPLPASAATTTTTATLGNGPYATSNYANKFGNYLQGEKPQQQQQQQQPYQGNYNRPPPHYSNDVQYVRPPSAAYYQPAVNRPIRPGPPPPPPRPNNNYYEYQLGELPPPQPGNYRPGPPADYRDTPPPPLYRPLPPSQGTASGGLASLASLLSSTQQYAPQFTNLLLNGIGGGSGPTKRPLNTQLIKALENIARNDDLQCVPKVLCTMIAGQTQRGQLPTFVTSPAITNFLAGFPASSPALIYGRAALLGVSGGESSCTQTYAKCPKNEYEILYYLNNHRGGFFKFFNEPEEQATPTKHQQQQQQQQSQSAADNDSTSLFSIFSALTGNAQNTQSTSTSRPKPPPTVASFDITDGIGNFFTKVLSEYLGGVEYQRRRRRRRSAVEQEIAAKMRKIIDSEDFHDEEDDEDTQGGLDFVDDIESEGSDNNDVQLSDVEGRVLHKQVTALQFFPVDNERLTDGSDKDVRTVIDHFNRVELQRRLKFPSASEKREYESVHSGKQVQFKEEIDEPLTPNRVNFVDDDAQKTRCAKAVLFKEPNDDASTQTRFGKAVKDVESVTSAHVFFPDHYEKYIRKGRIVNRPVAAYADTYADYVRSRDDERDRFVLANNQRRPAAQNDDKIYSNHNYNTIYNSQSSSLAQHNYNSNTNIYNGIGGGSNSYRPPAVAYDSRPNYGSNGGANYNYPNSNYVSNNRYSNHYQSQQRTTRAPAPIHEDDQNIYVTNSRGVTTYYVTPDGRKILI